MPEQPRKPDDATLGQVTGDAARVYEEFFVPALFAQFADPVCAAAEVGPGRRVLDVACGTGVVARAAARLAGAGAVTGLDRNPGMLAVAAERAPDIDWREGRAEALPFEAASFDAVTCQFGLMFFEDRAAALREMRRVARPGGRAVVAVWDEASASPGYAAMIRLLDRLFGRAAADALAAPFALGDRRVLAGTLDAGGWQAARIETLPGEARFRSMADWLHTEVRGWTLADLIDEDGFALLERAAGVELAGFVDADGGVRFAMPAHIAVLRIN